MHYAKWFKDVTGRDAHRWQERMGDAPECVDRLIRIPTGFGKTAGTVLPWLFHRVRRADLAWPTRLAFCLPMRTLVEQTEGAIKGWLAHAGVAEKVGVHVLMGGSDAGPWRLKPETPAILVGTQDMLLSRALNRGYGAGRGAWPMEFGLLHDDVLWVSDEIQLQDVGLATSAQLSAFRAHDDGALGGALRPSRTWWMSATLQPRWLETIDHAPHVHGLQTRIERIPAAERKEGLWNVRKTLACALALGGPSKPAEIAKLAQEKHAPGTLTLVILNTVRRAAEVFEALSGARNQRKRAKGAPPLAGPELKLVHSRFRGVDRRQWASQFLSREARPDPSGPGRIIVSTQVVEAGVDISARLLVTDLAPWPSLVQRFGRAARYEDETGEIVVVGGVPEEKQARPYDVAALQSAANALDSLVSHAADGSPASLERFEEGLSSADLQALYPYVPLHLLRRKDLDQLFDTSADLSGADVDVSRFIRSGEDRDVLVFWRDLPQGAPPSEIAAAQREELCPVPIGEMKEWLKKGHRAFRYDYLEGEWRLVVASRLAPGTEVLVAAADGGYLASSGWTPASTVRVDPVKFAPISASARIADARLERASSAEDEDALSVEEQWKTIAEHGKEAGEQVRAIGRALGLESTLLDLLDLAGRWHDAGKAHDVFQDAIRKDARDKAGNVGESRELAKAPEGSWRRPAYPKRSGFRHELASTLALFELLRRTDAEHPALLGPHREIFAAIGELPEIVAGALRVEKSDPIAREIAALDADRFDLLAWLVCTHHGKVRCVWSSTPKDQESGEDRIHGVLRADHLPEVMLATAGSSSKLRPLDLSLDLAELGLGTRYGASWGERVGRLLERHGAFKLAYLEALLRAADVRASVEGGIEDAEERR